jgi:hypothetical protein
VPAPRDSRPSRAQTIATVAASVAAVASTAIATLLVFAPGIQPEPPPERLAARIANVGVFPGITFRQFFAEIGRPGLAEKRATEASLVGFTSPANRSEALQLEELAVQSLRIRGAMVYADVSSQGWTRRREPLRAKLYDAETGVRVAPSAALSCPGRRALDPEREMRMIPAVRLPPRAIFPKRPGADRPLEPMIRANGAGSGITGNDLVCTTPRATRPNVLAVVTSLGKDIDAEASFEPEAASDQTTARIWVQTPDSGEFFIRLELRDHQRRLITYTDSEVFTLGRDGNGAA